MVNGVVSIGILGGLYNMSSLYNKIRGGEIHPIGIKPLSNWGGLLVYQINNDTCISAFNFGNGVEGIKETSIHYSKSGRPYIIRYQKVYYFDEIMRG